MTRPNLSPDAAAFVFEETADLGDWVVENLTAVGVPYSIITGTPDLSGYATTASLSGYVPTTRTVNGQVLSADVSITNVSGTASALATGRTIAITGDITYTSPAFDGSTNVTAVGTLADVNPDPGAYGSSTLIAVVEVDAKGRVLVASEAPVIAPAGTLTGNTLASGVTASSLTSVGTLINLTVTNTITGSITGNAATVTTNANLTGPVTSVGNATAIADGALSIAKTSGLQTALDLSDCPLAIVTESTTARSMALTDIGKYVRLTNASSCTITVPPNATVNWAGVSRPPILFFRIAAAGIPTLAGAGVTFNNSTLVANLAQHGTFALQWVASDVWDVI